jgi:putative copper export protein
LRPSNPRPDLRRTTTATSGVTSSDYPGEVTPDCAFSLCPERPRHASVDFVLPVRLDTIRLFVHVLAATVWVGGQLTLAGLVPGLRRLDPDAPRAVARGFNRIAWPAYGVLVATGIWNIVDLHAPFTGAYGVTLIVKIAVVAASGASAWLHSVSRTRRGIAVWGAASGLTALTALFLGVLLAG